MIALIASGCAPSSYLLHRSTQHEPAVRPTLLTEVGEMVDSDDEADAEANDAAPLRSETQHGCMIKACIAIPLPEGSVRHGLQPQSTWRTPTAAVR